MPVPARELTQVRSRRSDLIHITSLTTPRYTACGKRCDGWIVAPASQSHRSRVCEACQEVMVKARVNLK